MSLGTILKNIFIYKEPEEYNRFELLEDEAEDKEQAPTNQANDSSQTAAADKPKKKLRARLFRRAEKEPEEEPVQKSKSKIGVSKKLKDNLEQIKVEFNVPTNQDVVIREFKILQQRDAFIVYLDGLTEKNTINHNVLRQLLGRNSTQAEIKTDMVDYVSENLLSASQIIKETDFNLIIKHVLNGLTALFIEGCGECIIIESRGYEKRTVKEPVNETVIRGPQEGFIENLRTNISLVRRIIRNKDLITEILPIGKTNNSTCAILYIKGITNSKIVAEVKRRINSLDIDYIPSDGVLMQLIEDHPFALFPQILVTERPDRIASLLMEGKVAIMCDGSPFANIVPATFFHIFHTSEENDLRWQYGTFLRLIRIVAVIMGIFLPGLYIALTLYHREMIPSELLVSLTRARENVPFPTILELLLMELSWELIREAGVRVPGVIGQTLGIVGGVILGQAAVAAGLVSPILIIVVAITGLGNFAISNFSLAFAIRILRFLFIIFGAIAGFYGIAAGMVILGGLACSMKSFGVPYFSPVSPRAKTAPDVIVRLPTWIQKLRPDITNTRNRKRAGNTVSGWIKTKK